MTKNNIQQDFDNIFYCFVASDKYQIGREEYVRRINDCWPTIPEKLKNSLQRRKDYRSLGRFALDVYDSTRREKFLIDEWTKSLGKDWHGHRFEDHGVANDGRLIADTKGDGGKPDYRIIKGEHYWLLEVKFCPVQYKLTFKVCDLKSYLGENSLVLLIMGNTKMIGPNGDLKSDKPLAVPSCLKWSLFGRKEIGRMLNEIPTELHKEVGYKPSIQLKGRQIDEYLKIREWNYDFTPATADVPLAD